MNTEELANLVALLVFSGLAGARVFYVAEHWAWYRADPASVLKIWEGGLMFYGSIVAGAVALLSWCMLRKLSILAMLDAFAAVVPIGQAFGRVGCFLNGCCHGKIADGPLAVSFPAGSAPWLDQVAAGLIENTAPRSLPVIPVQLFETAGCALLGCALVALHARLFRLRAGEHSQQSQWHGIVFAGYLAGYGALRVWTETMRADERAHPFGGPLSISQAISVGALALAVFAAALVWRRVRRAKPGQNRV